jgi:O-antigen/teichoic acid export membrane protein
VWQRPASRPLLPNPLVRSLTRRLTRITSALPTGTLVTGLGVGLLGLASYVHLAVAGHTLSPVQMADLSVLWAVVFSLGYGLFLPVEQELTRVVAARRARGQGTRPAWRRGFALAGGLFAALTVVVLVGFPTVADRLYAGDRAMVLATLGGLLGVAAASPIRGQAAGVGRFGHYSAQLGVDGAIRIVLAAGLGLAGATSAVAFALVLVVAPLLATALVAVPVSRTVTADGPPAPWSELGRGVWPLVVSVLLGQVMLNSVIVSARLLVPAEALLASALLSALVLIRVPALVFGALQASLLSGLAGAAAGDDRAGFRRLLRHGVAVVTLLMAAFAVPLLAIGPWLARVLFGAPDVLDRIDLGLLTVGTWAYLIALVLGQGAMSLHRHGVQLLAWVAGAVVLVLVTLLPAPVLPRLEWAYLLGNATVAAALAGYLALRGRLHWPGSTDADQTGNVVHA